MFIFNFFKGLVSLISTVCNTYLTACFLLNSELRCLDNYPLFLMSLIDLIITGPGYLWKFFTQQFVMQHPSNSPNRFVSHGIPFYNALRYKIQSAVKNPIIRNIDPFWFSCLPNLAMIRVSEYGFGLCSVLLAYERYVLICKPTEKTILLSSSKRRKKYIVVSAFIVVCILADGIHSYLRQKWYCKIVFWIIGHGIVNTTIQYGFPLIFSGLLLTFCSLFYWRIARVMVARKKKVGRNLNLLLCFGTICFVWTMSLIAKAGMGASDIYRVLTVNSLTDLMNAPFYYNYGQTDCVTLLFSMTSLVDPAIIFICQKDYRILSKKQVEYLRKKIKIWRGA